MQNQKLKDIRKSGSAHEGAHHWLAQRKTALVNIPLMLWFIFSMIMFALGEYDNVANWLKSPLNCVLLIALLLNVIIHGTLGIRVVLEDYVSCKCTRFAFVFATEVLAFIAIITAILSILNIFFNASV